MGDHQSQKQSGTAPEVVKEMLPFAIYAVIPIIITLIIAFTFGKINN